VQPPREQRPLSPFGGDLDLEDAPTGGLEEMELPPLEDAPAPVAVAVDAPADAPMELPLDALTPLELPMDALTPLPDPAPMAAPPPQPVEVVVASAPVMAGPSPFDDEVVPVRPAASTSSVRPAAATVRPPANVRPATGPKIIPKIIEPPPPSSSAAPSSPKPASPAPSSPAAPPKAIALDARLLRGPRALERELPAARRHGAVHALGANRLDDVEPVVAQVRLAADEGDLVNAEGGEPRDHVEGLRRGELIGAGAARAGAAMYAGEIAAQRELPNGVVGPRVAVDVAFVAEDRQRPSRRRDHGQRAAHRRKPTTSQDSRTSRTCPAARMCSSLRACPSPTTPTSTPPPSPSA
jgi:hypothetical protein